jgi:hypothetical protein
MVTSRVLGILEYCKAEAYYIETPPIGRCSGVLVLLKDKLEFVARPSQPASSKAFDNEHHNVLSRSDHTLVAPSQRQSFVELSKLLISGLTTPPFTATCSWYKYHQSSR